MSLRLYKLTRTDAIPDSDYYDSLIVAARTPEIALTVQPKHPKAWVTSQFIQWECLGLCADRYTEGVIHASYNRVKPKRANARNGHTVESVCKTIALAIEKKLIETVLNSNT